MLGPGLRNLFLPTLASDARVRNSADVALLVVSGSIGGSCGIAFVNGFKHGITLGWVAKNCQGPSINEVLKILGLFGPSSPSSMTHSHN